MERKNILLILAIVLIATGIFFLKRCLGTNNDCQKLEFTISSAKIEAGGTIHFEDNSPQSNKWNWDFGNGDSSDLQSGDYTYNKAGNYIITLTVNGKCVETASIEVQEFIVTHTDSTEKQVTIIGPASCYVGDAVNFTNNTPGANNWEWQFGLSGNIDSKDQNAKYMYYKPGNYTVVLRVDASKAEGRHKITVMSKPITGGKGSAPLPPKLSNDQLKVKLDSITNGNFQSVYYGMISKYFCNNESVSALINGVQYTIYSYCRDLDFRHNKKISDVQIEYDKTTGCISKVTVTQK